MAPLSGYFEIPLGKAWFEFERCELDLLLIVVIFKYQKNGLTLLRKPFPLFPADIEGGAV